MCATVLSGELNGVIATTTPSGTRSVKAIRPACSGAPAIGTTSPDEAPRLLAGKLQGLNAPADLSGGVGGGKTGLRLHGRDEIVAPVFQKARRPLQDHAAIDKGRARRGGRRHGRNRSSA